MSEKAKEALAILSSKFNVIEATRGTIIISVGNAKVIYYPNREWYSTPLFQDGRGLNNLINKLENLNKKPNVGSSGWFYWNVDKEEFRSKGKVEVPMFSTTVFQEASDFKRNNPQSVIVRTCISGSRIVYQQITRHEVMSKYTTFDKRKSK